MEAYNIEKIDIRKMNVFLSNDQKQKMLIICRADKDGDIFGKYLVAHDASGGNHIFYLDDVENTDPLTYEKPNLPSSGWTDHRVPIAKDSSGTVIALALKTAFEGIVGNKFTASVSGKNLTVELGAVGYAHPIRDALKTADKTGFGFRVVNLGFDRVSIGAIEGDIEVSGMEQSVKEIQIHQEGETSLGERVTGYSNPQLTFNAYQTDKDGLKRVLLMVGGQTMLPEIEDAEEAIGYGPTAIGGAKPTFKVELIPTDAGEVEKKDNWTIWKAQFNLEKFTFSRTEFASIPLVAKIYPDKTKPVLLQFLIIGDPTPYMNV